MNQIVTVEVKNNIGTITDNLEQVKQSIIAKVDDYKQLVVTEDTIKESKKLLADIRKEQKELDSNRKQIKSEWMAPYNEFESRAKEIIALYDEPINVINSQLNHYEDARKAEKRELITSIYEEVKGDMGDWLPLDRIYNSKWENATASEKSIKDEMVMAFDNLNIQIGTIKSMGSEFEQIGLDVIKNTGDLQKAILEMTNRANIKKQLMEDEKVKAEIEAQKEAQMAAVIPVPEVVEAKQFNDGPFERKQIKVSLVIDEKDLNNAKLVLSSNKIDFEVQYGE